MEWNMLELLSEKDGNILGFKARGTLSEEDFQQVMAPRLLEATRSGGKVRLLLYLEKDFEGFDLEALKEEFLNNQENLEKIAVVGGSFMMNLQIRLGATLLRGEVQTFHRGELDEAWEWIKS